MVSYILAAFFTAAAILTIAGNVEISELMVAIVFLTIAALIVSAQHSEDKAIKDSKSRHPSAKPLTIDNDKTTQTEVYDWKNEENN